MERRRRSLVALATGAALSLAATSGGFAQGPGQPPGQGPGGIKPGSGFRPQVRPTRRPQQFQSPLQTQERWRQMSPEDRLRFRSNAERWLQLPPEQRNALRDLEDRRRQRIQRESEEVLQKSGLQLEAERREAWERQYLEERRRIERALRQEIEEKRQRELAPMVERLKKEFGQGQRSGSTSAATASPSPKK